MQLLKVIACLLSYPNEVAAKNKAELAGVVTSAREIPPEYRTRLLETLGSIYDGELMESEENYSSLFEQGRSLSLHLFEHVHGESRDRGQAMVDLMAEYSSHGFEIDSRELPDFLPMFLEYLAYRPDLEAREWLANVSHILAVLGARLTERQSPYTHLFESLLLIAGRSEELAEKRAEIVGEEPDNTAEALDREWEEAAVTFSADEASCSTESTAVNANQNNLGVEQPLRWVDAAQGNRQTSGGQTQ